MQKTELRYEKKIPLSYEQYQEFLFRQKQYGINFKKKYSDRTVNNIYFDNFTFDNFNDNLDGITFRQKPRLRWYGSNLEPSTYVFEVKTKQNNVGYKLFQIIQKKFLDINQLNSSLRKVLNPELCKIYDNYREPTLFNTYNRSYFGYDDIRLTIDTQIKYKKLKSDNILSYENLVKDDIFAVIEFKFPLDDKISINEYLSQFPFRIDKNSKYTNGVKLIYS